MDRIVTNGVIARPAVAAAARWRAAWQRLLGELLGACERQRQRRALGRLDEHLLRDIGVSPAQARHESGKPAWRQ